MKNLFERILAMVATFENNSQTLFAKKIGCQQSTFNGYMNEVGQRKIRLTLLEAILREYPQISRDWLYFGEGEMLGPPASQGGEHSTLESLPPGGQPAATQAQVERLEGKIAHLHEELLAAQRKVIELQEVLLQRQVCGPPAPIGGTAALWQPEDSREGL